MRRSRDWKRGSEWDKKAPPSNAVHSLAAAHGEDAVGALDGLPPKRLTAQGSLGAATLDSRCLCREMKNQIEVTIAIHIFEVAKLVFQARPSAAKLD